MQRDLNNNPKTNSFYNGRCHVIVPRARCGTDRADTGPRHLVCDNTSNTHSFTSRVPITYYFDIIRLNFGAQKPPYHSKLLPKHN